MARIAYFRVSTSEQSTESQRVLLGGCFDREFSDEGVSGLTPSGSRPGLSALLSYVREGDVVHVSALDRLGRDAIDVQQLVRAMINKGVRLDVYGLGTIGSGVGELVVAVLAQLAQLERNRIIERTEAGRAAARASLASSGRTHRGKPSLGRPHAHDPSVVRDWRSSNNASLTQTARQFEISVSTVSRYCTR